MSRPNNPDKLPSTAQALAHAFFLKEPLCTFLAGVGLSAGVVYGVADYRDFNFTNQKNPTPAEVRVDSAHLTPQVQRERKIEAGSTMGIFGLAESVFLYTFIRTGMVNSAAARKEASSGGTPPPTDDGFDIPNWVNPAGIPINFELPQPASI